MFLGPAAESFHFTPKHKCVVATGMNCETAIIGTICYVVASSTDHSDRSNAYETQG